MGSCTIIVCMFIFCCTVSIKEVLLSSIDITKTNTNTKTKTITKTNNTKRNANTKPNTNAITNVVGCPIKLIWKFHNSEPNDFIDIKKNKITIGSIYKDMVVNLDEIERYQFEKEQNTTTVTTTVTVTITDTITDDSGIYSCTLRDVTKDTAVSVTEFESKREERPTRKLQHGGNVVFTWEYTSKIQYQDILVSQYLDGVKQIVDRHKFTTRMNVNKTMMGVDKEKFTLSVMNATENDLLSQYILRLVFNEYCVIELKPSATTFTESTIVLSLTRSDDVEADTIEYNVKQNEEREFNWSSFLVYLSIVVGITIMLSLLTQGIIVLVHKRKLARINTHNPHTRRLLPPIPSFNL